MVQIKLSQLQPGMRLAQDVVSHTHILLTAGCVIQEKHLRVLRQWGLQQVYVDKPQSAEMIEPPAPAYSAEQLQHAREELNERFQYTNMEHPMLTELYRLCLHRHLQQEGR